MKKKITLTGITTTGIPHLGNYAGAIRPAINASKDENTQSFYFLADYHALIKCQQPAIVKESSLAVAATWLALGLDTSNAIFYRQSDVPEILELNWILTCVTAKGLMNRAHAYKAAVVENQTGDHNNPDHGITMGLFAYPVLMATDIVMFQADEVPVGKDQMQHLEMARDIALRFNHIYGQHFVIPKAIVAEHAAVILGLDGRKMSKSYNNTIALFETEKQLKKRINKIKTNSLEPGEPKDPEGCTLFGLYQAFADPQEVATMRQRYAEGIAWGEMKNLLFAIINAEIAPARARYTELMKTPDYIEEQLREGATKARQISVPFLQKIKAAVGILPLTH